MQNFKRKGVVNIADFKIKTSVQLDDKEARAKLESLKKLGQNDPIDLKINLKGITDSLNKVETMFKNAFKLDDASLKNLESVERTLKEINSLSKDVQSNLFSNKKPRNGISDEAKRIKEDNKVMLAAMSEEKKMRKQADKEYEKSRKLEQQITQQQVKYQEQMYKQMFDDIDRQQKQRLKQEQEYSKIFDKVDTRDNSEQQGLINQYKTLENTISKLQSQTNKGLGEESIKRTSSEIERLTVQLNNIKSLINNNEQLYIIDIDKSNKDLLEFNKNLSKIEETAKSAMKNLNSVEFINLSDEEGRIDSLKNELKQLIDMCQKPIDFNMDTGQALNRINEIQQEVKNLQQVESLRGSFEAIESSIEQAFGSNHVSQFRGDLESLESVARSLDGSFDIAFSNMNSRFKETQSQIKNINNEHKRTSKFWSDFSSSVAQYSMGNMIGDSLASGIRGSIQAFKDLDTAMVNVKRVAETSDIDSAMDLENIKNQAIDIGREIGASSTDVINGIASSLQAGMGSMKESIAVAKDALTLSAVADMNSEDASAAINTMVNGFKIKPLKEVQREMNGTIVKTNELTEAMDYLNFAGNNYAVSSADVAEALKRGGSVMSAYGISLGDSVAMITAANETMQDAPKVGNALKTIAMRMSGVTYKMKDGKVVLSDVGKALKDIAGIDVFTDSSQTEVKTMTTLLDELDKKYSKLSESEQLALSEKLSGKQNAATLQALLTNFDKYKQIRAEFANGQHLGSAEKELKNYTDSLAAKISEIKNIWLSIGSTIVKSDMTKGVLDAFISLSDGIDKVVKALDSADALLPAIVASFTSMRSIFRDFSSINSSKNNISSNMAIPGSNVGFLSKAKSKFDDIKLASMSASDGVNAFNASMTTNGKVLPAAKNGLTQFTNSLKQTNIGAKAVALTSGLLQGALISLGIAGIAFIAKKISDVVRQYDIAAEKNRENIENIRSQTKSLEEQKNGLAKISKEYDELSKKQNKSKEEQQRYNDLRKEIGDIAPELIAGTDADGNAILALNGSLDDTIKKLQEAIRGKNELLKDQQNNLGVNETKNIRNTVEKLRSEKTKLETDINNAELKLNNSLDDKMFSNNTFDAKLQRYKDGLNKREEAVAKSNEKILSKLEEYHTKESAIQQRAFNKIFEGKNYNSIKDDNVKNQINSFVDSLDWGKLNLSEQNSIISGFEKLSPIIAKNTDKAKEWSKTIQDANTNFQASGDVDSYKKELEGLSKELENLTGINSSTWIKSLTQEFGGLDIAKQQLHNFLQSYNSSMADLENGDNFATKLKQQFQDLQGFITDFTIDGKVNVNLLKDIKNNKTFTDLPQQIKEVISGVLGKDDKVTEVEQEVLLKIATTVKDEGKISDDVSEKLNKLFSGKLTEEQIKVPIKLDNGMEIGADELAKLNSLYKENPVKVNFVAEVSNEESLKNISSKLDGIPIDKQIKVDIETGLAQGNIDAVSKAIESLPPEKQLEVIAAIESAMTGITSVEKKKLSDKLVKLKANATDANNKIDGVNNKKVKDKSSNIKAVDKASSTIKAIDDKKIKDKKFTITTVFKKIGDAINGFVEKTNPYKSGTQSIERSTPISTPSQVNTFSALSQPQASPMLQAQANETGISSQSTPSVFGSSMSTRAISNSDVLPALDLNVDLLKKIKDELRGISSELDILDKMANNAFGKEKISYLNRQIELMMQQQNLQHQLAEGMRVQANEYKYLLSNNGVKFDSNGNVINSTEKLLALEKEIKAINDKKEQSDSDKARQESLNQVKNALEEYLDLTLEKIPDASEEWLGLAGSISDAKHEINKINREQKLFSSNNKLTELENEYKSIGNALDFLDKKSKSFYGDEKIDFLNQQTSLLEQQKNKLHEIANAYREQLKIYQSELSKFGFTFNELGAVNDIDGVLNGLVNSGELEEARELLEEYLDIQNDKLPQASADWWDLNSQIKENRVEMEKLRNEIQKLPFTHAIEEAEHALDRVKDKLDLLDALNKHSTGKDKLDYLEKRLNLLEQEKKAVEQYYEALSKNAINNQSPMLQYGFKFDESSLITNYDEVLNKYIGTDQYEMVKKLADEYMSLVRDKIPEAWKDWLALENEIKDTYKNQLNTIKDMEDKVTAMLKKQVEDRKKIIDEESKKRMDAINKEKQAYNDMRSDQKYKDNYEEQKKKIEDLNKQIELAKQDDSLSGQKRLDDLLKQLNEENKKLNEMVEDKIDKDINDAFDNESNRLEEEAEKAKDELDKIYADDKLQEMVDKILSSGVFTDLDGNVKSLQDAMLQYIDKYEGGMSAIGGIIKDEWLTNLKLVQEYLENMPDITDKLGLGKYSQNNVVSRSSNQPNQIQFNAPLVNVQGNIDVDVWSEVQREIYKAKKDIIDGFYKYKR